MLSYDLVVIGSGPAGEKGAATAAEFGRRAAIVERDPYVGGASTNTGTLPSKTLRETALALSGLRARDLYGVDLSLRREATVADFLYHENRVKLTERARVVDTIHRDKIDLYRGHAEFADPNTVLVKCDDGTSTPLKAEKILIATGSAPVRPHEFRFEDDRIHDSDEILSLYRLPRTLAVIGAGVIGAEYACTFAALGAKVFLLDGRDVLLPFLDCEVSEALAGAIERVGVTFYRKERVLRCDDHDPEAIEIVCESGRVVRVDQVLVAAGRRSNTETLNLAAAGITPGQRGLLIVNEFYQTSVPHIYAAGDVIGFPALAATSAEQARVAMCHAFDFGFKFNMAPLLPTGIYTIPEVSMVGETEESLNKAGIEYVVGRASYAENARGQIIGDHTGFLKLLFRKSDMRLLGAHAIGEQATEVIHIGLVAMMTNSGADLFHETCFNYPTLGDLYKAAAYDALMAAHRKPGDQA
ncbi:MAG: Si-specific NAD(P)(+) transhydrogenase [Bryobacterales bacterium]|nr:Si-specific NAD(P)(+) transhydrogenase [Bryobacterales bacterium]